MEGIERAQISTPFNIGRVNCYGLTGNGLTVVDPGPATQEAWDQLAAFLDQFDFTISDIQRVLITHPHIDHFGQVRRIVAESGAEVLAHTDAVDRMADPIGYFEDEQGFFGPFLLSMGMPEKTVETVLELPESYVDYQDPVTVTRALGDGDEIDVGLHLKCVSAPGHNPGSLCFIAASEDVMFTGDHVLPNITPNPLLTITPGSTTERTRSLPMYLASLRKISDVEVTVGFSGHGEPILGLRDRVQETIEHHQERKERIRGLIDENEPVTAYELMRLMFPDLPATEMFPGMSEIIGHLDLLEDEDRVAISDHDGVAHYELT